MERIGAFIKRLATGFWGLSLSKRTGVIILIVFVAIGITRLGGTDEVSETAVQGGRAVSLMSVRELSLNTEPLVLSGTVTSRSEAVIRSEASGKLISVRKRLGDYVGAGEIIAEIENGAQRAFVTQAEGAYEAAKAGRDIAGINKGSAGSSLSEAKTAAQNSLFAAYSAMDDVVRAKTDGMWDNPQEREPRFTILVTDEKLLIRLKEERVAIESMLRERDAANRALGSESDLVSKLTSVEIEVRLVKTYLDDLALALSRAFPNGAVTAATIDGWRSVVGGSRTAISATLTQVGGSRNALLGAIAGVNIAEENAGMEGGAASDAQLKSALGNLEAARAQLEKTLIRSPISGTINSLSVDTGDIISPFADIAIVSNNFALEIVAYITERERGEFSVGSKAVVEGGHSAVVTRIAPALDPRTKKIEVRLGLTGTRGGLINGQSVSIDISRTKMNTVAMQETITIPLSALKLSPSGAAVFTVDEGGALRAHVVEIGALSGERIEITAGLTGDMRIVTDARGLKEGMVVTTAGN